jgi:hypothetical protein
MDKICHAIARCGHAVPIHDELIGSHEYNLLESHKFLPEKTRLQLAFDTPWT